MLTSHQVDTRRLRVDSGQTGFFECREGRMFYEFDIAPDTSEVIKVVAPVNTIVQRFGSSLVLGELRIELVVGGTEGGTFDNALPVFSTNTMDESPSYSPQVTFNEGGTHTGGDIVDLLLLNAGSPATQAREVTATEALPVGFAAGTFYIRLVSINNANARGVFRARWEERP